MYAIKTENIIKQYKNGVQALSSLSLSVKAGEIFSLLGENGAGKSTLIRILTPYIRPTSGKVTMLGGMRRMLGNGKYRCGWRRYSYYWKQRNV